MEVFKETKEPKRIYKKLDRTLTAKERLSICQKEYYHRKGVLTIMKRNVYKKLQIDKSALSHIQSAEELYDFVMKYMKQNNVFLNHNEPKPYYDLCIKLWKPPLLSSSVLSC